MTNNSGLKKSVEVQLYLSPIDKLIFDPINPRLPTNLHHKSEAEILRWMLQDATLIELVASIGVAGFFAAEPLLVIPSNGSGQYIVIEGNRRLASVKLLQNPDIAPIKKRTVGQVVSESKFQPTEVPVVIYNERKAILDYLGYRHITGIKEWSSLAKARYMAQLYDTYEKEEGSNIFRRIAKLIGSRSDYVKKLLSGLWVFEEIKEEGYFDIASLNEDTIDFSLLTTAIGYTGLKDFLGVSTDDIESDFNKTILCKNLNTNNLGEFTTWLFKETDSGSTRLGESRNLKYLNKIVQNDQALEAFKSGERIDRAAMLTSIPLENLLMYLSEVKNGLDLANETMRIIDNPTQSHVKLSKDIVRIAKQLEGSIKAMCNDEQK